MGGLRKTCHLAHLNGRGGPEDNEELSFRHVQNSLRGGKSLSVKIKRFSQMVMSIRLLETSRLGLEIANRGALL